jgi:hypothetical protein
MFAVRTTQPQVEGEHVESNEARYFISCLRMAGRSVVLSAMT